MRGVLGGIGGDWRGFGDASLESTVAPSPPDCEAV